MGADVDEALPKGAFWGPAPKPKWRCHLDYDSRMRPESTLSVDRHFSPGPVNRWLQRVLLGITWKRLGD